MKKNLQKLLIILLIFIVHKGIAQSTGIAEVDTMIMKLQNEKVDTAKVDLMSKICWKLRNSHPQKATEFGDSAISLATKINYHLGMSRALSYAGVAHRNRGNYVQAMQYYFMGLDTAIKYNDLENKGYNLLNIGNVHIYQNKSEAGLPYLFRAIEVAKGLKNKQMEGYAYLNIGRIKLYLKQFDESLMYLNKSLHIREEIKDEGGIAVCYNYLGVYELEKKDYKKALRRFQKSYDISSKINQDLDLISDVSNQISQIHIALKNLPQAEFHAKRSLDIAEHIGAKLRAKIAHETLAQIYDTIANFKEAYTHFKLASMYKDSLFDDEKERQILEMATIYQTEERKKESIIKDMLLKKNKLQIAQQKTIITLSVVGFVIVLIFSVLLFTMFRQKNRALKLLNKQNNDIIRQKNQIMVQAKEIRVQRDAAREQRDEIIKQKQSITDSIQYAKRIQNALHPPTKYIDHIIPEHFVLFKPRDIVSGDFYLLTEIDNYFIFAAADCTGHGVPGAFMSMLASSILKEVLRKVNKLTAAQVLDKLRDKVISALHQTGKTGEAQDGLDIALCILNRQDDTLQFAGAYNPLLIVRTEPIPHYIEIKADKMPIGIHMKKTKLFTNNAVDLMEGDKIYLFSDGFVDQIGGAEGKKFMIKQFRNLLVDMAEMPLAQQHTHLENVFTDWLNPISDPPQEPYKQVDDILVMGLRIK